ncbi:TRAP transporter substrate-binding protein [Salipiger sp. P9]|uniref:TRAP transporter substrate-binding protein n=1 Tax=Salipiger pentaromativorans TaxID=2943193 RepID=UPI00215797BC|nr:TRAP transporter substrate-binding protein [Salipiger pentaromativorans]MCR8547405.1 TRAP transporter substrate-binding protein [Salipiger pentaromativorans]
MKQRILGAIAACAIAGSALAEDKVVEMTFSHDLPTQHPLHAEGFQVWADSIAEASGGTLKIGFFPAGQLGKAEDEYDIAKFGIADFVWANPGHTPGRFPIMSLGELPFFIKSGLGGTVAMNEWYADYMDQEMGDVKFCVVHLHDPGTLHSREEIRTPAQIKGTTIRPANGTIGRLMQSLGGSSVQVGPSEAREVLERGAADGITFPWRSISIFGMDDVVHYHLDMPLYVTNFIIVMNKDRYQALSETQQAVIDDHCTPGWGEKIAAGWVGFDNEGKRLFEESPDHHVIAPTGDELAQWKDASAFLLDDWKQRVNAAGLDAEAIYQGFVERLEAHDAKF